MPRTAHIACCEIELNDALQAEIAIQSFSPIICSSAYHEKTTFIVGGADMRKMTLKLLFLYSFHTVLLLDLVPLCFVISYNHWLGGHFSFMWWLSYTARNRALCLYSPWKTCQILYPTRARCIGQLIREHSELSEILWAGGTSLHSVGQIKVSHAIDR